MFDGHREKNFRKMHNVYAGSKKSLGKSKDTNEIKNAFQDNKRLKRNKKRLSIDWFFRPD